MQGGATKALIDRVEAVTGLDIDGDGQVGNAMKQAQSAGADEVGTCQVATQKYMKEMGATYAIVWEERDDGKFHVKSDFTTPERRKALKKIRGDDKTFSSESRSFNPAVNGRGPIATVWRTGQEMKLADTKSMIRAKLAEEFGIKKILFKPVPGGVLEVGTPSTEELVFQELISSSFAQLKAPGKRTIWQTLNLVRDIVFTARLSFVAASSSVTVGQGIRLVLSDLYVRGLDAQQSMMAEWKANPIANIGKVVPLFFLTIAMSLVTPAMAMTTATERYYNIKNKLSKKGDDALEEACTLAAAKGGPGYAMAVKVFSKVDKNGDGLVSEEEWEKAFGRESSLYPPLRPFAQVAKGNDGVSLDDFLELVGPHSMLSDRVARAVGVVS